MIANNIYSLSPMQYGMLLHSIGLPGVYISQLKIHYEGVIDRDCFRRAWYTLLMRHDIFRTAFFITDVKHPVQVVYDEVVEHVQWIDLSSTSEPLRAVDYRVTEDRLKGFDLKEPPLIRVLCMVLGPAEGVLLITHHHAISDHWTQTIFMRELLMLYEGEQSNTPIVLPAHLNFKHYLAWRKHQTSSFTQSYWKRLLTGYQGPLCLDIDEVRPVTEVLSGSYLQRIEETLTDALQQCAKRWHTTLSVILQAAFSILLSRFSRQQDVLFGLTVSGRSADLVGIESICGPLINAIPVRCHLTRTLTVRDLFIMLHKQYFESNEFDAYSLFDIQQAVGLKSGDHLFQYLLAIENQPKENYGVQGLSFVEEERFEQTHYPLTLLIETGSVLRAHFLFQQSHFSLDSVIHLARCFVQILKSFTQDVYQPVHAVDVLTPEDRHQILTGFNCNKTRSIPYVSLIELFWEQVSHTPANVAVFDQGQTLTYRELKQQAQSLALYLHEQNVMPGDRIAIYLRRGISMVVAMFAVLQIGACYVPIEPGFTPVRVELLLKQMSPRCVLTQTELQGHLPKDSVVISLDHLSLHAYSVLDSFAQVSASHLAYLLPTSGSTGEAKNVCLTHQNALNFIVWCKHTLTVVELSRVLASSPLSFDLSIFEIFVPLCAGGCVVIAETILDLPDIARVSEVTLLNALPSSVSALLSEKQIPDTVKTIILTGEDCSKELAAALYQQTTVNKIYNAYGPTECGYTTFELINREDPVSKIALGHGIANTRLYVLDQYLHPVPLGVKGELYIAGDNVADGYWQNEALTQQSFIKNPFDTEYPVMYKTGDQVRFLSDGRLDFIGRFDDQVKIRGYRVELSAIERAMGSHAKVKQAVAMKYVDEKQHDQLLVYVHYQPGVIPDPLLQQDLARHMQQLLPHVRVPDRFITINAFPLTGQGKINRQALPTDFSTTKITLFVEPRNNVEAALSHIWCDLLKGTRVSVMTNFFECGGHSLLMIQMISAIKKQWNISLPIRIVFDAPTIEQLAIQITLQLKQKRVNDDMKLNTVVCLQEGEKHLPPLFLVHPIWGAVFCYWDLVRHLNFNCPVYAIQDPGFEEQGPFFANVEAMAAHYVTLIQRIQPEGPYTLAGYSFGGTVCVEIAKQLMKKGETISFLGVIDAWAHYSNMFRSMDRLQVSVQREYCLLKSRLYDFDIENPKRLLNHMYERLLLNLNYTVPTIETPLTLFKAIELYPEYAAMQEEANYWHKYTKFPMTCYRVPGNHETLLFEPHVQVLAEKLRYCLLQLASVTSVRVATASPVHDLL